MRWVGVQKCDSHRARGARCTTIETRRCLEQVGTLLFFPVGHLAAKNVRVSGESMFFQMPMGRNKKKNPNEQRSDKSEQNELNGPVRFQWWYSEGPKCGTPRVQRSNGPWLNVSKCPTGSKSVQKDPKRFRNVPKRSRAVQPNVQRSKGRKGTKRAQKEPKGTKRIENDAKGNGSTIVQ